MLSFKNKPFSMPLLAFVLLSACEKQASQRSELAQQVSQNAAAAKSENSNGTTTRTICFTAIAEVAGCIGENIKFGGTLELKENTVTTDNGVHYTRHWTVKEGTGIGVMPGGSINNASTQCPRPYTGTVTGTQYDVVAGQEMFSVKDPNTTVAPPSAVLSGEVFIHQGTIVFVNRSTRERYVVRHVIIKNPGQEIFKSGWYMEGKSCSNMMH